MRIQEAQNFRIWNTGCHISFVSIIGKYILWDKDEIIHACF